MADGSSNGNNILDKLSLKNILYRLENIKDELRNIQSAEDQFLYSKNAEESCTHALSSYNLLVDTVRKLADQTGMDPDKLEMVTNTIETGIELLRSQIRSLRTNQGGTNDSILQSIKRAAAATLLCLEVMTGLILGGLAIRSIVLRRTNSKAVPASNVDPASEPDNAYEAETQSKAAAKKADPKRKCHEKKIVIVRKINIIVVGGLFLIGTSFHFICKRKCCHFFNRLDCRKILKLLESPTFGLAEIKTEVKAIEDAVFNPFFGLKEIKSEVQLIAFEVQNIEKKLDSPTFGLAEIKTEVFSIGTLIESIFTSMIGSTFGLAEIKSEVAAIEGAVFSATFGLAEIKTEIFQIQNAVFSPTFGLQEIKSEVAAIEANLGGANAQTSGPFKLSNPSVGNILDVKVMNNSAATIGPINVSVFTVDVCPKTLLSPTFKATVTLPPYCTTSIFFNQKLPNSQIEIEVSGAPPGKVFIWSRTTPTVVSDQIEDELFSSNYLPLLKPLDP